MGTEVDSLEVKVEASAKSANASLTNLAKRLGTVSQQLQSVCSYQPSISVVGIFLRIFKEKGTKHNG